MSVEENSAPLEVVTPPAAPVAPENPAWLPGRLSEARETERKKLLQDFGVEKPEDLKAKLARLSELEAASLSEQERTQKQLADLSAKAQQFEALQKTFTQMVESEFSSLNDQQKSAIDARANGDAQKRWEIMDIMKAAGALTVQPPAPKPATTAAPGAPPPPASPKDPKSPRAIYEAKKQIDPMAAELYRQMHAAAIEASPA
jgi:flagellar hook-basal body complex protein FliE